MNGNQPLTDQNQRNDKIDKNKKKKRKRNKNKEGLVNSPGRGKVANGPDQRNCTHLHRQVGEVERTLHHSSVCEDVVKLLNKLKVQTSAGTAFQMVIESCKSDKALLVTVLTIMDATIDDGSVNRGLKMGHEPVLPLENSIADQALVEVIVADVARQRSVDRLGEGEDAFLVDRPQDAVKMLDIFPCGNGAAVAFEVVGHGGRGAKHFRAERALVDQWLMHVGLQVPYGC